MTNLLLSITFFTVVIPYKLYHSAKNLSIFFGCEIDEKTDVFFLLFGQKAKLNLFTHDNNANAPAVGFFFVVISSYIFRKIDILF